MHSLESTSICHTYLFQVLCWEDRGKEGMRLHPKQGLRLQTLRHSHRDTGSHPARTHG